MNKLLLILMSLLILVASLYGQASYTTVTATLVDTSGQIWANATVIASLRPAPNNPALPLNNGLSITDTPQTIITDNTGTFTLILDNNARITPAGSLWTFNIYPNASVQNGSSISLAVTGTTLNLSGVLSSILIVPNVAAAPVINRAYADSQVNGGTGAIYWNTTANSLKGCVFNAGVCTWVTISSFNSPGFHFYIPYNNGNGGFTASVNLQFNDVTNTFSTINGTFTTLLSNFFQTNSANPAQSGIFRMSNTDTGPCWRNFANAADLCFSVNTSNQLLLPGTVLNASLLTPTITTPSISNPTTIGTDSGTETMNNKTLVSPAISNPTTTGTDNGTETLGSKTLTNPVINGSVSGTALQGNDTKLLSSGTNSGTTGAILCVDANNGATTSGCPSFSPSFNAPQRTTTLASGTFNTNGTQQTFFTISATSPATAGTYRALVSYLLWVQTGANICNTEVVESTHAYAPTGENPANVGWAGFAATEVSGTTYVANTAFSFSLVMNCNGSAIPVSSTPYSGASLSPTATSFLSVTFVSSN